MRIVSPKTEAVAFSAAFDDISIIANMKTSAIKGAVARFSWSELDGTQQSPIDFPFRHWAITKQRDSGLVSIIRFIGAGDSTPY